MEIKISSRSKSRKSIIEALVKFYAKELKLETSNWKLVVSTLPNLVKNDSMRGWVFLGEDKTIIMGIDSRLNMSALFSTVAHEMVHVKQHVKGQLKQYVKRNGKVEHTWMGRKTKTDALDSPWELEAYSKEVVLSNKMTKFLMKKFGV